MRKLSAAALRLNRTFVLWSPQQGQIAILEASIACDFSTEPDRRPERFAGRDRWELDFRDSQSAQTASKHIQFDQGIAGRNLVSHFLQSPSAGGRPELCELSGRDFDFVLGSLQFVATLHRQETAIAFPPNAYLRAIGINGQVPLLNLFLIVAIEISGNIGRLDQKLASIS